MLRNTSEIRLSVHTDNEGVDGIHWEADDAPEPGEQQAAAMILALWDGEKRNAMRIDLWTKEMTIEDMNDFFFQTLLTMADTYKNATNNRDLMADIKAFAQEFAEKASRAEMRRSRGA
jgi:gliding motility-associated protein GldC